MTTAPDHEPAPAEPDDVPLTAAPRGEEPAAAPASGDGPHPFTRVVGERAPTQVDVTEPVLPQWLRDRITFLSTTRNVAHRVLYRARRAAVQLPRVLALLVLYSPRGLARVTAAVGRYLYDQDTAELRHHHARNVQTAEYQRAHTARKANLHARWVVAATLTLLVVGPVLAFVAPSVFAAAVGITAGAWTVKLIPGRGLAELGVGAGIAAVIGYYGPRALELLPRPPVWPLAVAGIVLVLVLGWHGRNREKRLAGDTRPAPGVVLPLRADVTARALCDLGNSQMKEPEQVRILTDVARCGRGAQLDMELPGSVRASWVVARREDLAAALKRELGCVWPEVGARNAAHLKLYVADQPLAEQPQRPWPLAKAGPVDLFAAVPMFTNQRGEWVDLRFVFASMVIGAVPRMGKTFVLRQALLACSLDPRARIYALDGKGTGDLAALAQVAHFYSVGDDPEEIERVVDAFRALRTEMRRRARVLRELPREDAPESKVTSALANRRNLALEPIVIGIDETQVYFGYGDKSNKDHKAIRDELDAIVSDLVKRGPALGIVVILATQQVNAQTVPSTIANNIVIRVALKLEGHEPNDRILGTGAYRRGIDAQMFSIDDKGIAYLKAEGRDAQIVRSVAGLDAVAAEKIGARARALREAAGRLTGDAADEQQAPAPAPNLVDDVRDVMTTAGVDRIHLGDLRARLALLRSDTWSTLTVDSLGAHLREGGITPSTVWAGGKDGKGVKREWLDAGPDDDVEAGT